jgi:hypothetical protein
VYLTRLMSVRMLYWVRMMPVPAAASAQYDVLHAIAARATPRAADMDLVEYRKGIDGDRDPIF